MKTVTWPMIAAAWGILLAGAAGVMKTTDAVHSWVETHLSGIAPKVPPYTWIGVACGVGVVTCTTSHLNPLLIFVPTLPHLYGEVLSGFALGGIASPGHHLTAWIAAKSNAVAVATEPPAQDAPGNALPGQDVIEAAFGPSDTPSEGEPGPSDPTAVAPASDAPPAP